jgi:hypothetical protein
MVYRSSSGTLYRTSSYRSSQNNSSFYRFEKTGNYVGIILSILWIVLAIYLYYIIYNSNDNTKNYYYIMPTLLILFVVIANGIYIYNVNNDKYKNVTEKNTEFIENAKSRYANILLAPIYIIIISLIIFLIVMILL